MAGPSKSGAAVAVCASMVATGLELLCPGEHAAHWLAAMPLHAASSVTGASLRALSSLLAPVAADLTARASSMASREVAAHPLSAARSATIVCLVLALGLERLARLVQLSKAPPRAGSSLVGILGGYALLQRVSATRQRRVRQPRAAGEPSRERQREVRLTLFKSRRMACIQMVDVALRHLDIDTGSPSVAWAMTAPFFFLFLLPSCVTPAAVRA